VLLDNIQAICGRLDGAGRVVDASPDGPVFGGTRPQDQQIQCSPEYAVTFATVALNDDHPQIGAISISCTELANRRDGGSVTMSIKGSGNLEGYSSSFGFVNGNPGGPSGFPSCGGNYAVGIRGRAAQYLNAFGLICGPATAAIDPNAGHTLGKRKKPKLDLGRDSTDSITTSIPQPTTGRTLGKRKRPAPTGGAASESKPNPMPEQQGGVSIFTDSTNVGPSPGPAPEAQPVEPPSPLINGTYSTTVAVTDSRCLTQDLRGTWRGLSELKPQPALIIPLQNFGPMFAAPVAIQVQGLVVSQSTQVEMRAGPVAGAVPAEFNGAFSNDGSEFNVRFTAGSPLCRIAGTISGQRL
jgi:hypothetical protein